jgi:hypothetical protein
VLILIEEVEINGSRLCILGSCPLGCIGTSGSFQWPPRDASTAGPGTRDLSAPLLSQFKKTRYAISDCGLK